MVFLFNKNIKNTLSNCIFHDDDRDPLWINDNIKQLIQEKNDTYRNYILNNKNPQIFHKIKYLQKQLKNLIERSQEKYYCSVLKKINGSGYKSNNLLANIKNIVKQQQKIQVLPFYFKITSK